MKQAFINQTIKRYFLFLLLIQLITVSNAQVLNDSAKSAMPLPVNAAPFKSDTKDCTLEEKCIDRKLTSKCLVYHNDQWFTFTTGDASVYYLSIRNQDCRDVNGVQLQVIDGTLCKPSTYKVLECISLATQDDIYVKLTTLKKNHTYIINVDGYLNDFCKFEIDINTSLPNFAIETLSYEQDLNGIQRNGKVTLEWKLNQELEDKKTELFEIRRRFESEKKFNSIGQITVDRTVHGTFKQDYSYTDTVERKGFYYYKIVAIGVDSNKYLVGSHNVLYRPITEHKNEVMVPLNCKDKSTTTILIYNWENNALLGKMETKCDPNNDFKIDLEPYFRNGYLRLTIKVEDRSGTLLNKLTFDRKP